MLPILYSFRRCPYAMRTRLTLGYAGIQLELREIVLRDKPSSMLEASPKGTVPVLVLPDGEVLDESWDIMQWALQQSDPDHWMGTGQDQCRDSNDLVTQNDFSFKLDLDRYKYADRHPEQPAEYYRAQGELFLSMLEQRLGDAQHLLDNSISIADVAIFPFVRQFAFVDKDWFDQTAYPHLHRWLDGFLGSELFHSVMKKYSPWKPGDEPVLFP